MFEYIKALFAQLFSGQPTIEQTGVVKVLPVNQAPIQPQVKEQSAPIPVKQSKPRRRKPANQPKAPVTQPAPTKAPVMQPKKKKPAPKKPN